MSNRYDYKARLPLNIISDKTKEVLPEYFVTEYPDLVKFLDIYYEFMEKDDEGFSYIIQGLYQVKDIDSVQLAQLDSIFREIGNNRQSADFFANPRFVAKVIASFYKAKGSKISAEGFFKAFFGEEANIIYPKRDIFIVNESAIGPDSVKYIQDAQRYQIHSILIQSGLPVSKWRDLFKLFVHPAGWYLSGDVAVESTIQLGLGVMPEVLLDSAAGLSTFEETANVNFGVHNYISRIVIDDTDTDLFAERISLTRIVDTFLNVELSVLNNEYNTLIEMIDENSPTFDNEDAGGKVSVTMSNAIETMDQSIYDYWDSDAIVFQYQDSA